MDRIVLNKQAREMKETLLDNVNEMIMRQNRAEPLPNFESFVVENACRKVLREMLGEYNSSAEDLKKKMPVVEDKVRLQKA